MHKAWNPELQVFGQCYEETDVLDSAVLIMPLVFFITPVSVRRYPFDDGSCAHRLLVRSEIREHTQAHLEDSRERWFDIQRKRHASFVKLMLHLWIEPRLPL